jgi:hypothetical protein
MPFEVKDFVCRLLKFNLALLCHSLVLWVYLFTSTNTTPVQILQFF